MNEAIKRVTSTYLASYYEYLPVCLILVHTNKLLAMHWYELLHNRLLIYDLEIKTHATILAKNEYIDDA